MTILSKFLTLLAIFLPSSALAQGKITELIGIASGWLTILVYIFIGLAVVLFFWGIIKYVISADNEEKQRDARNLIIYGVAGLFVMVAIWGIVYLIAGTLGVGIGGSADIPELPGGGIATDGDSLLVDLIVKIGGWIAQIATFLIGLALVFFLYGVSRYIASGPDEEKRAEARRLVAYGVTGLFVMVAVWGLVYLIGGTIGVGVGGRAEVPQIEETVIEAVYDENGVLIIEGGRTVSGKMESCTDWSSDKSFKSFVCLILKILQPIPPILIALAVLYFFWGVTKYIKAGGDSEALREGRNTIIFGLIGLFVIIAIWGLVYMFQAELGLG